MVFPVHFLLETNNSQLIIQIVGGPKQRAVKWNAMSAIEKE